MGVSINEEGTLKEVAKNGALYFHRLLNNTNIGEISGATFSGTNNNSCNFKLTVPTDFTNVKVVFTKFNNGGDYENNTYIHLKYPTNDNQIFTSRCNEWIMSTAGSVVYHTYWLFSMAKYDTNTVSCQISRTSTGGSTYDIRYTTATISCIYAA